VTKRVQLQNLATHAAHRRENPYLSVSFPLEFHLYILFPDVKKNTAEKNGALTTLEKKLKEVGGKRLEVHYTVKAIYTREDLQSIISKNCELLSAQHHTLIGRGCLILFRFVISSLRIPCLFAQYVLMVTGSTAQVYLFKKIGVYRKTLPRLLIHLDLHKMCPQARLLYLQFCGHS